jgi:L-cysteine desulfidase
MKVQSKSCLCWKPTFSNCSPQTVTAGRVIPAHGREHSFNNIHHLAQHSAMLTVRAQRHNTTLTSHAKH